MKVHFIDVCLGNMTLIEMPNGKKFLYDCNITDNNRSRIFAYLDKILAGKRIDSFINSHRDSDHMRGIAELNSRYGIGEIWDNGVAGVNTDTNEYNSYMNLKRQKGFEIKPKTTLKYGDVTVKVLSGKNDRFNDANEESLVIKIDYKNHGVLLTGDTSYSVWKNSIVPNYKDEILKSDVLLASHHGSIEFFGNPLDVNNYYEEHIEKISPKVTVISAGDKRGRLPDDRAIRLYEKYSSGHGDKKFKVLKTNKDKTIVFTFRADGSSSCDTEVE